MINKKRLQLKITIVFETNTVSKIQKNLKIYFFYFFKIPFFKYSKCNHTFGRATVTEYSLNQTSIQTKMSQL
jgi:hypothetical protein